MLHLLFVQIQERLEKLEVENRRLRARNERLEDETVVARLGRAESEGWRKELEQKVRTAVTEFNLNSPGATEPDCVAEDGGLLVDDGLRLLCEEIVRLRKSR